MLTAPRSLLKNSFNVLAVLMLAGTLFYGNLYGKALSSENLIPQRPAIDEFAAQNALSAGFSDIAESIASSQLQEHSFAVKFQESLLMTLASAQIEQNKFSEAIATLQKIKQDSPQKQLRLGLAALGNNEFENAAKIFAAIEAQRLSPNDAAWLALCRGILAAKEQNPALAKRYFSEASLATNSAIQRAHFEYLQFWAELILNIPREENLSALKERVNLHRGSAQGAQDAKLLAYAYIALSERENREENLAAAQKVIQECQSVPKNLQVEFKILEALAQGSPASPIARHAYLKVIQLRPEKKFQTFALEGLYRGVVLLEKSTGRESAILAANEIKRFFENLETPAEDKKLVPADSTILDFELFTRLRIAHLGGDTPLALKLAGELTEKCPTSNYAPNAYRLLLTSALQEREYRKSVAILEKQRDLLPRGPEREIQNIYIADCYFLNGDYELAANAYEKIDFSQLGKENEEIFSGVIFAQLVLSQIKANRLDIATKLVDDASAKKIPDAWRQRADCALISALRDAGKLENAELRCQKFLQKETNAPWQFQIAILEMSAILALEMEKPMQTIAATEAMAKTLESVPENEWPKDFLSQTLLLKIRGLLKINDPNVNEQLTLLRERFPDTLAAGISYLEEARSFAQRKQPSTALACYEKLIERYGNAQDFEEYIAIAYFEAAQQALTLGRQRDAIRLLDNLVQKFPASQLCFYARLRQADLFRVLNDFDSALAVYDSLLVAFPDHADLVNVGLARADCLLALALAVGGEQIPTSSRASNLEKAIAAYERLYSLPGVSCELMAEAGYKWGYALSQTEKIQENLSVPAKADLQSNVAKIYFLVCNTVFNKASSGGNDPQKVWGISSGYWLSRCLFALAELYEDGNDYENARKTYTQIINWSARGWIPGGQYAQNRLNAITGK